MLSLFFCIISFVMHDYYMRYTQTHIHTPIRKGRHWIPRVDYHKAVLHPDLSGVYGLVLAHVGVYGSACIERKPLDESIDERLFKMHTKVSICSSISVLRSLYGVFTLITILPGGGPIGLAWLQSGQRGAFGFVCPFLNFFPSSLRSVFSNSPFFLCSSSSSSSLLVQLLFRSFLAGSSSQLSSFLSLLPPLFLLTGEVDSHNERT